MRKPRKQSADFESWAVYLMRAKGTYRHVEARDEAEAIDKAIKVFGTSVLLSNAALPPLHADAPSICLSDLPQRQAATKRTCFPTRRASPQSPPQFRSAPTGCTN